MRFFRQTLLVVCLALPCAVLAQPVANDDTFSTTEDNAVSYNIVANDTDATDAIDPATVDLDVSSPLTVENTFSIPATGSFSVDALGMLTFTPVADFNGPVTLQYTVKNNIPVTPLTSAPANIDITVDAVDDAPTLSTITDNTIAEDAVTAAIPFTIDDVETAATSLVVSASSSNALLVDPLDPLGIVLGGTGTSRTITLKPLADQNGATTIEISVYDGALTTKKSFVLNVTAVDDIPTITAIVDQTIPEDGATTALAFTVGDAETSVASLTVSATSSDPSLVLPGGFVFGGSGASRDLTITPVADQYGTSTIEVSVFDGALTANKSFLLTVTAVNDLPTITPIADQTIVENTSTAALSFTVGDTETLPGSLTLSATSSNASLVVTGGLVFGGGGASRTITITPVPNQTGTSTIDVTVSDGTDSAVESFLLTVTANNPPTITSISNQTIPENGATSALAFTIGDVETPIAGLSVSATSSNGSLVNPAGLVLGGSGASRTITVTPLANQSGTSTIQVTVSDGALTAMTSFLLTVTANNPPTITSISNQTIPENGATSAIAFTIGDVETPVTSLTVSATSSNGALVNPAGIVLGGSGASRTITLTPLPNQSGTSTIQVTVSDGFLTAMSSFLLTVTANTPPTITSISNQTIPENGATSAIAFTIGDVETPVASLTVSATSSNGALVNPAGIVLGGSGASRTIMLTPLPNQSGTSTIQVTVSDGSLTAMRSFLLTVTANTPPTITSISNQTIPENGTTSALAFTIGDAETPIAGLTVSATSSNASLVNPAGIVLGGSGASRTITVTPLANQSGTSTIQVTVSDGALTAMTSFLLTVTPNAPPTITSIANQSISEDGATGNLPFTIGDAETPATSLTVTATSSNAALVNPAGIVLGGSGAARTIKLTPLGNQNGTTTIQLNVSDGALTTSTSFVLTVNPVDDSPSMSAIADITTNENTPSALTPFTVGDIDTPVGSLTVTGTSNNQTLIKDASIQLVDGGSGSWTVSVTPELNAFGTANITLVVHDATTTAQRTFKVTVTSVNDLPTISAISNQTINEDVPTASLGFNIADTETAANALTVTAASTNTTLIPVANIVISGTTGSRSVVVTPAANQSGSATVTLTVADGDGGSAQTSFNVLVNPVNDAPQITAVSNQTINEDATAGPLTFNVTDPETASNMLTVTASSSNPALVNPGGLNLGGTGTTRNIIITPLPDQSGTTTITLGVSDGGAPVVTTFTLTVNAVNDIPTITSIATQNILENAQTGPLSFTISDIETLATALTLTKVSSNTALVDDAGMQLGGSGGTRNVNIIPKLNQFGSTTITLSVSDGGQTAMTAFLVNVASVDSPPVISPIAPVVINEDTPSGLIPFIVNDAETLPGVLDVTGVSDNTALIADANIQLNEVSDGNWTVRVVPTADAFGVANITLTVNDGTETSQTSFQVTVNSVNDLPTITTISNQTILEDASTSSLTVTISDIETPLGALNITGASNNTTLVPVANISETGSGAVRTIIVTPTANAFGVAQITLTVTDANGGTASSLFQLTVTSVNDAPTIDAIANQNINEDTPGGTGVLSFNIGDIEAGTLVVTRTTNDPTLVPLINIVLGGSGTSRTVRVTPAANLSGTATITLTVTDGGGQFATSAFDVIVAPINDDPTITSIANQTISEGTATGPLAFTVGDIETPAASLTVTRTSSNTTLVPLANVVLAGSGPSRNVNVTPALGENGVSTITLFVDDGTSTTQTAFQVTVSSVDDPPTITAIADQVVNEDNATAALSFTIGDPDTPVGSLNLTGSSDNPAIVPNGNIVFGGSGASRTVTVTPASNANGTANITVSVSDGTSSVPGVFQVAVTAVNDAPTITAIADQTTNEDTPTGDVPFTIGDIETGAGALTVTASSGNTTLIPDGNITLGGSGASRTIRVTPAADASGTAIITVNVSDGSITTPLTYQVTVNALNDAPTITAIADQTVVEDNTTGALAFTIGDEETPPGSLTLAASSSNTTLVPIANVVLGGSGASRTVTVTPAANQTGTTTITITVDDGVSTKTEDFDVTFTPVNDPPTMSTITDRTINEDASTGNISFTISDPDNAATTLVVTATSSNTTLVPNANITLGGTAGTRTINVAPAANGNGSTIITLEVTDGTNITTKNFTLNVTPINDLPQITAQQALSVNENTPITLLLSQLTVVDPDNLPSEITLYVIGGANYSITGLTTITPIPNFYGNLPVNVFVGDGTGTSPPTVVNVTVISTNDPPVITNQSPLTMNEDQTLALQVTDFTIVDPDSPPSSWSLVIVAGANYTFSGTTITPGTNVNGDLPVSVRANDGSINGPIYTAHITIAPVNDPPVIIAQSPLSTNEETALTLAIGNVTVLDPEPTTYTLSVLAAAPSANYTVSGNTITPIPNFTGTLTVPVTASDGSLNSPPYDLQVSVLPVNDAPVITGQNLSLTTIEEVPITIGFNDLTVSDVDNTYPTGFSIVVIAGANYSFSGQTITPDPNIQVPIHVNVQVTDGAALSNIWSLLINVTAAEDAPVITGQNSVSLLEDTSLEIFKTDLVVVDPDTPDPQRTLFVMAGSDYTFSGNTITPNPNVFGTLSVNVRIYDGEAYSNIFPLQVTVFPVNDAPFFNAIAPVTILEDAATQTLTITGITSGPLESQTMTFSFVSDNTALIPNPVLTPAYNGTAVSAIISFKPQPNASGTATIRVELQDGGSPPIVYAQTFTITVTPVNDAPTLNAITVAPIDEDVPEVLVTLTGISPGGGPPESDQKLIVTPSFDNPIIEIPPPEYVNGQSTGTLRILTKPNAFGTVNITVRIDDDGNPAMFTTRTFALVINSINDKPEIVSTAPQIAEPGVLYEYQFEAIDVDVEELTISSTALPSWLTLTPGTNGKAILRGTPPGPTSPVTFQISVTDPDGLVDFQDVSITVNTRPRLSVITISTDEDVQKPFSLAIFDSGFEDDDGNSLAEVEITKLPVNGQLRTSTGAQVHAYDKFPAVDLATLVYTPAGDFHGLDSIRWNGADGFGLYANKDVRMNITVNSVNDLPIITQMETDTLKYELGSEAQKSFTETFVGIDPDGDDIVRAEIRFNRIDGYQFRALNDKLTFVETDKIKGKYDEAGGFIILEGRATSDEYNAAIRSIKYSYVNALDLTLDTRSLLVTISDGIGSSLPHDRPITLIYTFEDLNIPSAFSPNEGDDVNQTWVISSPNSSEELYDEADIKVYDKRGLLLYQARGLDKPWNGVYNGSLLPPDTYFYTIDLHYNRVQYKGMVTLLR